MANTVTKIYSQSSVFTPPAGVTSVIVSAITAAKNFDQYQSYTGLVDINSKLYMWGGNTSGFLGSGNTTSVSSPVLVVGALSWSKFAGSNSTLPNATYGLTNAGALYVWGTNNGSGQFGTNGVAVSSSPVLVVGGLTFSNFWATGSTTFGITQSGKLYAWGQNSAANSFSLGVNTNTTAYSSPVLVSGGLNFTMVQPAQNQVVGGLTTAGQLYMWGNNANGNLGDGTSVSRSSPVLVVGGLLFNSFITYSNSGSGNVTLGITPSGTLYSWGSSASGALGNGTSSSVSSPVLVLGGLTWSSISLVVDSVASYPIVFGLTNSGALYSWGSNSFGMLGNGTVNTTFSSPTLVLGGLSFQNIITSQLQSNTEVGVNSIYGLTNGNSLYAWGQNSYGQLGDGTASNRSSPVAVLGGLKFSQVVVTNNSAFGITPAGVLYAWGLNTGGQLADGTNLNRSSPVAVLGGLTWATIFATSFGNTIFGVTNNGQLYAWGVNGSGEVGDGTTVGKSSPVLVLGGLSPQVPITTQNYYLAVTPGATYPVTISSNYCSFGSTIVGQSPLSQIVITYQQ